LPTFDENGLRKLNEALSGIQRRRKNLLFKLYRTRLQSDVAQKYLTQGVLRRLSLIVVATQSIFEVLPPETVSIPSKPDIDLATIHIHAAIFNTFGLLDCWAHVWANELNVQSKKGEDLSLSKIGLGEKYHLIRESLPPNLRSKLEDWKPWLEQISERRHALAHRIPPYIPPYLVDPKNEAEYLELDIQRYSNLSEAFQSQLPEKLKKLSHFKPIMLHDLEKQPPLAFHAHLISDFLTVEELCLLFSKELSSRNN
jgi:hypothetical protein